MGFSVVKRLALAGVARGVRVPENPFNRYQELLHLNGLLDDLGVNCVIDAGANTGQFARELRASGFGGLIVSFEPVRRCFEALVAECGDDPKWRGHQLALGDEDTRMTINVTPSMTVMSSFLAPRGAALEVEEEEVQVRRLDGLLDEVTADLAESPRVFLKMDTQGFDLKVFAGASGCLDPILGLQSELSVVPVYEGMTDYLEALAIYRGAGFGLFNLSVVTRGDDDEILELNCFMRRGDPSGG
jgi:FkbM family methyltransferase